MYQKWWLFADYIHASVNFNNLSACMYVDNVVMQLFSTQLKYRVINFLAFFFFSAFPHQHYAYRRHLNTSCNFLCLAAVFEENRIEVRNRFLKMYTFSSNWINSVKIKWHFTLLHVHVSHTEIVPLMCGQRLMWFYLRICVITCH